MLARTRLVIAVVVLAILSGCAGLGGYQGPRQGGAYGGHGSYGGYGGYQNSGAILGGVAGAAVGSILSQNPAMAVLGGVAGVVMGGMVGGRMDAQRAAEGVTNCNYSARKGGHDENGSFSQEASGRKTIPGTEYPAESKFSVSL